MKLTRKETAAVLRKRHQDKVRKIKAAAEKPVREFPKADRGRVIDRTYRAWVRRLPCIAGQAGRQDCCGPIEAAHLRFSDFSAGRVNPGLQRKSDDVWCLPLCRFHHQSDQHQRSERAFWEDLGVEPNGLCQSLRLAYEAGANGSLAITAATIGRAA